MFKLELLTTTRNHKACTETRSEEAAAKLMEPWFSKIRKLEFLRPSQRLLRRIATFTRSHRIRGIERLLRRLYHPGKRETDRFEVLAPYDNDLLIYCDTGSFLEWQVFFHGHYEADLVQLIRRLTRPGDVIIDVGANIGCHSLIMSAAAGREGHVYAIEPHPRSFQRLQRNIIVNRLSNVDAVNCAFGSERGELVLHAPLPEHAQLLISSVHANVLDSKLGGQPREHFRVLATTLDQFMIDKNLSRVDLIKIDVEGHELPVLTGGYNTLRRFKPYVIFEQSEDNWKGAGYHSSMVRAFFGELGYGLYRIDRDIFLPPWMESDLITYGNILAVPSSSTGP